MICTARLKALKLAAGDVPLFIYHLSSCHWNGRNMHTNEDLSDLMPLAIANVNGEI